MLQCNCFRPRSSSPNCPNSVASQSNGPCESHRKRTALTPRDRLAKERRSPVKPVLLSCGLKFTLLLLLIGCQQPKSLRPVITGETMGTQYRVTFADSTLSPERVDKLRGEIESALKTFNRVFSTYDPESVISRFNNAAADEEVLVSDQLIDLFRRAAQVADDSGGAFDPTVGPLVNRWQFGPGRKQLDPPTDEEIRSLKSRIGYKKVSAKLHAEFAPLEMCFSMSQMMKSVDGVQLDLSAIAKGHAVDILCERLEYLGLSSFLVDIGGELRAVGKKADGSPWNVAVRNPEDPLNASRQSKPAALIDAAMATSGSYFNFHEVDGVRYSHTIDPRTGRPVTHDLASVTIVACDCETADAYATTLMVLGPDAGYDWASERGVAAMLIRAEGAVRMTDAYTNWLSTGTISCPE